jgi:protein-tyrosine-phosphatase/DNA-binding transcriptional ArsR family regulator
MDAPTTLEMRAARHAALGDPVRLAIVDELSVSDRAPVELRRRLGMESNLLSHHLDVLDRVGLIERSRSSGDGRRRYVHLLPAALDGLAPGRSVPCGAALFVCSANSARSQLAAALWHQTTGTRAASAGTHPAGRVHPGAVAAARRAGLDLREATPHDLAGVATLPPLVITVCDRAHEELDPADGWLHWSIPDPVPAGSRAAFDATVVELRDRIRTVVAVAEAS